MDMMKSRKIRIVAVVALIGAATMIINHQCHRASNRIASYRKKSAFITDWVDGWTSKSSLNLSDYMSARQSVFNQADREILKSVSNTAAGNEKNDRGVGFNSPFLLKPKLMSPGTTQQEEYPFFTIVLSAPSHQTQRAVIRETWATDSIRLGCPVIFIVGGTMDNSVKQELFSEAFDFQDLLIADFMDSYHNLTIKSAMMLKYLADNNVKAKFIVKSDDDVYINIKRLYTEVSALISAPPSFYCHVVDQSEPIRQAREKSQETKWLAPFWMYPKPRFPPYCAGTFYVFDGTMISSLHLHAINTPILTIEDVFVTGIVRERARIGLLHLKLATPSPEGTSICQIRDRLITMPKRELDLRTIHFYNTIGKIGFFARLVYCWLQLGI